jgi:adenylate kinase
MKLLFLGPPGAGKGTQAERVAESLHLAHISTGDMFRWHVSEGTDLGQEVSAIMELGDLVPDSLTISMLNDRISKTDALGGYILDGFPRTLPQAQALDLAIGEDALTGVIVLEVPEAELIGRLLERGRADDTEESVRNRLNVYAADTEPLVDFYQPRGVVVRIQGVGEIDEISERILAAVQA